MKKHLPILLILAIAFGAVFTLASCDDPTFGLEEVSFEDIANAKLYDKYNVNASTTTYDSESNSTTVNADPDTMNGSSVKAAIALKKTAIAAAKTMYPHAYGDVYANKDFSKIVVYVYYKDGDNKLISKSTTTYTKK